MASKANTSTLLNAWKLQGAFELAVVQSPAGTQRTKTKLMGTVIDIRDTEKGRVEGKTDQVLMLLQTSKQDEGEPAYALQVALLDYSGLSKDLLTAFRKGLLGKPSLIQIARKPTFDSRVYASHKCLFCRKTEECAQEMDEGKRCR